MKQFVIILVLILTVMGVHAQNNVKPIEGSVSYITSQNIYVRFKSTKHISAGDTLFINRNHSLIPMAVVTHLSSTSCVSTPLSSTKLQVGNVLLIRHKAITKKSEGNKVKKIKAISPLFRSTQQKDSSKTVKNEVKQEIYGRISLSSYSNFSNRSVSSQRMRSTFSLTANNISNSKFSAETYISFVPSNKNWGKIKSNIFDGLKIYDLSIKYQGLKNMSIWLGRHLNRNLSSIGTIDGLQVEKKFKSIYLGGFVGSRPNNLNYSFDFSLFQYGAYVAHVYRNKKKHEMRTTFAFVDQQNAGKTDRRFAYIQHYNGLAKDLYLFGTAEFDLYQNINGVQTSNFNLTNLYMMLRYRVMRQLSFSLSYSTRKNIIYYETYKNYLQRLIDDPALRGFRFQVNYRPLRKISIGLRAGYNARKTDPRPSKNLNVYIRYAKVPGLNASANVSATFMESAYLSGGIYSLNLSRDLIPRKLYGNLAYRFVNYKYSYGGSSLQQHIGDISLNWNIIKKLTMSLNYEGTFGKTYKYNSIYINLTKRF